MSPELRSSRSSQDKGNASPPVSTFAADPQGLIRLALTPPESLTGFGSLDHYEVLELIGGGSMGYVLRAHDRHSGRIVAIKMLKPELAHEPLAVRRFLREARHMKHLHHPHILPLTHVVDHRPGPYLVMPWIEKGSLAERLAAQGALTPEETLQLAHHIAEAIVYAHRKGIIHRDIKPGNVLLGERDEVWLADFGLARTLFNDSLLDVRIDQTVGTLPYMSPGRVQGVAEDTRTDIYAFGCLLYEMLSGRPPYEGDTVQEVSRRVLMGPPVPIRQLKPGLGQEWTVIIEGAMARDLRNRYASMADLACDLERMARGETPQGPGVRPVDMQAPGLKPSFLQSPILWVSAVTLGVLALLTTAVIHNPEPPSHLVQRRVLSVPGLYALQESQLVHWWGMPDPLLCVVQDDSVYHVSLEGDLVDHFHLNDALAEQARFGTFLPKNSERPQGMVVSWRGGPHLHAAALDFFGEVSHEFTFPASPKPVPESLFPGVMSIFQVTDFEGDGRFELLAGVETTGAPGSRHILCFDFDTGELLWQHSLDARAIAADVIDMDSDGQREILLTLHGEDSRTSGRLKPSDTGPLNFKLLDAAGQDRWNWAPGSHYDQVFLLREGSATAPHFVVGLNARRDTNLSTLTNQAAAVFLLSTDTSRFRHQRLNRRITSGLATDLDGDGDQEILVTDDQDSLHVFTADLQLQKVVSLPHSSKHPTNLRLLTAADLDADGHPEIVLDSSDAQVVFSKSSGITDDPEELTAHRELTLLILDETLEVRASHRIAHVGYEDQAVIARVEVVDIATEPGAELIYLLREKAYLFSYIGKAER